MNSKTLKPVRAGYYAASKNGVDNSLAIIYTWRDESGQERPVFYLNGELTDDMRGRYVVDTLSAKEESK
jgi:hypothetical protein